MNELKKLNALMDGKCPVTEEVKVKCFVDGSYGEITEKSTDVKAEIYTRTGVVMADIPAGFLYELPASECVVDYAIAKYHTKIAFRDCILTVSAESGNPYLDRDDPWFIYGDEWLMRHLNSEAFMKNCRIKRLRAPKHLLTREEPYGDLDIKAGYDVYRYTFFVEDFAFPYYEIAVVRAKDDMKNFALFVMKSQTENCGVMDAIVESFTRFEPKGEARSYFHAEKPQGNPNWNQETKDYFHSLYARKHPAWGVFSYSMPGLAEELDENSEGYRKFYNNSVKIQAVIEKGWGKKFDIYPTYTHIGKGTDSERYAPHHFPSKMAAALADGDGKNGKPVLQFTYQFTLNNNLVFEDQTPMFDILRGKYDEQFRQLARDIKAYRHPVLFRLNNEMNTDWTSYCGMMTLLDPDIFNETWIRLYNIFEEEGVDNCIWIWNPIATTCPYCSWGEDLCYFPGVDYVQLLGGTSYEMNNYPAETAPKQVVGFRPHYEKLYRKNSRNFTDWCMIISEFACGAGGSTSGELGRNIPVQANWVKEMFECLNADPQEEWVKQIKGAVWFNCDDIFDGLVGNRLRFIDPDGKGNEATVEEFRKGFANAK